MRRVIGCGSATRTRVRGLVKTEHTTNGCSLTASLNTTLLGGVHARPRSPGLSDTSAGVSWSVTRRSITRSDPSLHCCSLCSEDAQKRLDSAPGSVCRWSATVIKIVRARERVLHSKRSETAECLVAASLSEDERSFCGFQPGTATENVLHPDGASLRPAVSLLRSDSDRRDDDITCRSAWW